MTPDTTATILTDQSFKTSSLPFVEHAAGPVDESNPVAIHQFALDATGSALDTGDFEMFAAFFHLPHYIETFGCQCTLHTLHDLRLVFDNNRSQFEEAGNTHRVRNCISAVFKDEETILATHLTRIMHRHQQMREPVPSYSVLKLVEGVWKIVSQSCALEETDTAFDRLLTRKGVKLNFSGG